MPIPMLLAGARTAPAPSPVWISTLPPASTIQPLPSLSARVEVMPSPPAWIRITPPSTGVSRRLQCWSKMPVHSSPTTTPPRFAKRSIAAASRSEIAADCGRMSVFAVVRSSSPFSISS